jgi:hypothetical protein
MHPRRLATLLVALTVAACDDTVHVVTGISQDGGGTAQDALAFTVQPAGAGAGEIITPPIQVTARDTLGNTDQTFTGNVTIRLLANPTGAFLTGTKTVAAVFGVASFGDLSVDKLGSGYTLVASAVGATQTASGAFAIVAPSSSAMRR